MDENQYNKKNFIDKLLSVRYLTRKEAAAYLGLSYTTLAGWVSTHRNSPPYYKFGNRAMYTAADLDAWAASNAYNKSSLA